MKEMEFTKEDINAFKERYNNAVSAGEDTFVFKYKSFYVGYAKYVIEYLNRKSK